MEKHITVTEEKTNVNLEADKGTRVTNQVNNNIDSTRALSDEDVDEADNIEDVEDELEDDENVTEEKVIVEEEIDEDEDLDDEDLDDEDEEG